MFRRYPYWGWLLVSLALWSLTGYDFSIHRQALLPERMALNLTKDLHNRNQAFTSFITNNTFVEKIFSDSFTPKESVDFSSLPFYVFAYYDNSLIAWNTNVVLPSPNDSANGGTKVVHNEKGIFLQQSLAPVLNNTHEKLVVIFPVALFYPIENEYIRSHFVADGNIPVKTRIVIPRDTVKGDYPIIFRGQNPIFYLRFNKNVMEKWPPDLPFFVLLLLALAATMSWLQLMTIYHTRNNSPLAGFIITAEVIVLLRGLILVYGYPFNLDILPFFSPRLYASNMYDSSLADLYVNTFCVLWIVVFITRHTPYRTYFSRIVSRRGRFAVSAVLLPALSAYVFFFVNVIRSLVHDSSISFDVGHFASINVYSLVSLFIIGAITGISCLVIFLFNIQISTLLPDKRIKYLCVTVASLAYMYVAHYNRDVLYWALTGWLLLFVMILDNPKFALVSDLFEPRMLFWAAFIGIFCTVILEYFIIEKEHIQRLAFAQQEFTPNRDYMLESKFDKTATAIKADATIKDFFLNPTKSNRKTTEQYFDSVYLHGEISKYDLKIYFFDAGKMPLFNKDNASYQLLESEKDESSATNTAHLYYNESVLDRHYYLSIIELTSKVLHTPTGYIVLNLNEKKQVAGNLYPELLEPQSANTDENSEYAYAMYVNGKLIKQTNDNYPFNTSLKDEPDPKQPYVFLVKNNISELHYSIGDKRVIVVVHLHSQIIETLTLFSYIFGTLVTLALFILLYQLYLSYISVPSARINFIRLTLRKRVHLAMLGVIFLSFIIVGGVTIYVVSYQYHQSVQNKLQATMASARLTIQDYLSQANGFDAHTTFDTVCKSQYFHELLFNIAITQKIDINIYDDQGGLLSTTQDDIYSKGLTTRLLRPDAYYRLRTEDKSAVIQNERIAGLSYLSAYEPLRDESGNAMGYINVPFFSSEKNLNLQISNVVVTLINLYAFIFLVSSAITLLITRWVTRSFNMIIKQFGAVNLEKNERISWPYDDEILLLVNEYNNMVNKVEENATRMAQSERERAWREMARQVAHEIKNPLTPMKLNIQYLKQAMKNDYPNIKQLTERVADSIIEQIDNLSYIASEFSNFAKMPEAKAEEIELCSLVTKAAELYANEVDIKLHFPQVPVVVISDRSQLLRVFTNLLENAVQAAPPGRVAEIAVTIGVTDHEVRISVSDNGSGIPESVVANIFQPYFTTKSSGTGLGLAMTKKIIEFWKGDISFESQEGAGTTFYITLPFFSD